MRAELTIPVTFNLWLARDTGDHSGISQILAFNRKRASLTIQNLSLTATLYFGFGGEVNVSGVGLGPGKGVIYDVICPQHTLYLFMDAATVQQCGIMEISYV